MAMEFIFHIKLYQKISQRTPTQDKVGRSREYPLKHGNNGSARLTINIKVISTK